MSTSISQHYNWGNKGQGKLWRSTRNTLYRTVAALNDSAAGVRSTIGLYRFNVSRYLAFAKVLSGYQDMCVCRTGQGGSIMVDIGIS